MKMFIVVLSALALALASATSVRAQEKKADAQVKGARRDLAALERQAYAKNPKLRAAEKIIADATAGWNADRDRRGLVEAELIRLGKIDRDARRRYNNLIWLWAMSLEPDWLADPEKAPLLQYYLTVDPDVMVGRAKLLQRLAPDLAKADLTNKDAFWDAYSKWTAANKQMLVDRFETAAREAGFNNFVIEQASRQGEFELVMSAYRGFAYANTPPELNAARERLRALERDAFNARFTEHDSVK